MSALPRSDELRFEPMTPEALDEVAGVEVEIYPFPWSRGNFRDALKAGNPSWLMRAPDGSLAAYSVTMMALDEAHLLNLSVAAPWQRRGLGWRMLDWNARCAREYGALTMLLEVRPSNLPALHLYERYGFRRIGERRGYYPAVGGREDAIVMRLSL